MKKQSLFEINYSKNSLTEINGSSVTPSFAKVSIAPSSLSTTTNAFLTIFLLKF